MIILTNKYFQYLRPGDNLLYCPIKSEEVENMIDLKEKNVLCTTKDEAAAILKEAEKQGIRWYDGDLATAYNPLIEHDGPIVLTFKYNGINWIGANATDTARDLLNPDREMTAHEFLNKFLDMAYHCSNCEECKTIKVDGCDYRWCDSDLWTKDNIDQVYEIVKTGNKLKEKPEYLDGKEQLNINALKLAIKVLEEKINEK
jgi:hypothetical protein